MNQIQVLNVKLLMSLCCFFITGCGIFLRDFTLDEINYHRLWCHDDYIVHFAKSPDSFGIWKDTFYNPADKRFIYIFVGDSLNKLESLVIKPSKTIIRSDKTGKTQVWRYSALHYAYPFAKEHVDVYVKDSVVSSMKFHMSAK